MRESTHGVHKVREHNHDHDVPQGSIANRFRQECPLSLPDKRVAVFRVAPDDHCAYDTVARHLRHRDRPEILEIFTESALLGTVVDPLSPLVDNNPVLLHYLGQEPEVEVRYSILFEDTGIVVVDKGPHYPIHPSGRFFRNTLVHALRIRGYTTAVPVHRLDQNTTGVVVFAKSPNVARRLGQDFSAGTITKEYLAVVHGTPSWVSHALDEPIGPEMPTTPRNRQMVGGVNAKPSLTYVRVLATKGDLALVLCRTETGRRHQIRVHLSHAGYPIVGDTLYGAPVSPQIDRTALHAARIRFFHPTRDVPCEFVAALPQDMVRLLKEVDLHVYVPDELTYSSCVVSAEATHGDTSIF